MQSSDIPVKFQTIFASGAGAGFITQPLPATAQPNGRASLVTGFSTLNFDPLASGGIPPWGADFNGLGYMITAWLRWAAAGGVPVKYDSSFSTAVGGYPLGAFIASDTLGHYWISGAENNTSNPNSGGANWIMFPDVLIQQQSGNFCIDTGTPNAYVAALTPVPASLASIIGSPIRVRAANANTNNTPTIHIITADSAAAVPMINSDGTNLRTGQIARANQIFEGLLDGLGNFQVTSPGPQTASGGASVVTGVIYGWTSETPPTWGLECNGARYNISAYPNLYNVTGNRFNAAGTPPGDGVNTFNVPDVRGVFLRGWDHGRGLDPDAGSRTSLPGGGTVVGDHIGSWEASGVRGTDLNGMPIRIRGAPNIIRPTQLDPLLFESIPPATANENLTQQGDSPLTVLGPGTQVNGVLLGTAAPGVSVTPFACYGLDGFLALSGGAGDTRPVNLDIMFVIAF